MDKRAGRRGRIKSGRIVLAMLLFHPAAVSKGSAREGTNCPPPLNASAREGSRRRTFLTEKMCDRPVLRPMVWATTKSIATASTLRTVFSAAARWLKGTLAGDAPYHSYLRVGRIGALFARGRSLERRTPIDETGRKLLNGGRYGGTYIQTIRNALIYQ
jgi:hypothetical protein